jgi:hypothetical protein
MTKSEKFRAYSTEPVLATLLLSLAVNWSSMGKIAAFVHTVAKDALSILVVLFAAVLAVWIGLFWIAGTPFGAWLQQRGERDDIDGSYIYTIWVFFIACIGAAIGGAVGESRIWIQVPIAWVILLALLSTKGLITNTRSLLRLHAHFVDRSSNVTQLKSERRSQDTGSGR